MKLISLRVEPINILKVVSKVGGTFGRVRTIEEVIFYLDDSVPRFVFRPGELKRQRMGGRPNGGIYDVGGIARRADITNRRVCR